MDIGEKMWFSRDGNFTNLFLEQWNSQTLATRGELNPASLDLSEAIRQAQLGAETPQDMCDLSAIRIQTRNILSGCYSFCN